MNTAFTGDSLAYFNIGRLFNNARSNYAAYQAQSKHSADKRRTSPTVKFLVSSNKRGYYIHNNILYVLQLCVIFRRWEFIPMKPIRNLGSCKLP